MPSLGEKLPTNTSRHGRLSQEKRCLLNKVRESLAAENILGGARTMKEWIIVTTLYLYSLLFALCPHWAFDSGGLY